MQNVQQSVVIGKTELPVMIYKNGRVITLSMMDTVHQRPEGTAKRNFNQHKDKLIEGVDYETLTAVDLSVFIDNFASTNFVPANPSKTRSLVILYETGYLMLVKSFTDDLAWQVQRELVNKYFATPQIQNPPPQITDAVVEYAQNSRKLMAIFGIESNMQTLALNNAMRKEFGVNLLESWGMDGGLKAETQEQLYTVTEIAKKLGVSRTAINPILIELGLQTNERDHNQQMKYELTDKGHEYGVYLDVGKRRSDGTPVRQIKWYTSVIDVLKMHLEARFVGLTA